MNKKIIIIGEGGSGKNFIREKICKDLSLKVDVSYTTREKREGEREGKDYYFIRKESFEKLIDMGLLIQWDIKPNGHYYGTHIESYRKNDVFIMSPNPIKSLSNLLQDAKIIYLKESKTTRKQRMINRGDGVAKASERIKTEYDEFKNLQNILQNKYDSKNVLICSSNDYDKILEHIS